MEILARDLRYALRGLARMRVVAAVAIATLALGIGVTTTMFSVVWKSARSPALPPRLSPRWRRSFPRGAPAPLIR
jgi:hypothetical protein